MNAFPLAPFLYALMAEGISVSFGDYDRISTVLSTGDKWTRSRLRGVLTALLAHNRQEADRIERSFDRFFLQADVEEFSDEQVKDFLDALHEAVNDKSPVSDPVIVQDDAGQKEVVRKPVAPKAKPIFSRPVFWCAIAGLVLAGIAVAYWIDQRGASGGDQGTGTTERSTPTPTPDKTIDDPGGSFPIAFGNPRRPRESSSLYSSVQYDAVGTVQLAPTRHRWTDLVATIAAFMCLVLVWLGIVALISNALRDPPPQFNPNSPRVFPFSALGEPAKPQLDGPTLDRLADSINYFLSTRPSKRLDINRTIKETGRHAGMPVLCFHQQRQVRRVCIFEDSNAEPLIWNKVTGELLEGLSKRGVEVLYGRFAGGLDRFVMSDGHTYWLDDLDNERRDSLFLFFSDGKHISSHRDVFALERLAKLPLVAWFDFREPKFWDETALLIKVHDIPLYQASAEGLMRAFDRFLLESSHEHDDAFAVRQWRGFPPYTDGQLAVYIEHLLGDALVWAQACAMIQPLSLNMADTLRRKFHPHLPPERIERLFRLPGTAWQGACIRFSREVMAALRGGFFSRLSSADQESVLNFIEAQIRLLEPPKGEKSLRRLVWEWTLRRVQLESKPDDVLPILSQLSQTPLGSSIKWDLSQLVFVDQPMTATAPNVVAVPLRTRPVTPKGVAYLKDFSPHIVMSSSLPKRLIFSWQRVRFILGRVQRHVWSQLGWWWTRVKRLLRPEVASELSVEASALITEPRMWAEPEELQIKRIFVGESKTRTVTFRTNTDLGLAGRIVSDNEWLKAEPNYCDQEGSEKPVTVLIDSSTLNHGKHAGNITFLPSDNSEPIDVPVELDVYRSWTDVATDWWRTHRPKSLLRTAVLLVLILAGLTVLTFKVLPGNWPNRLYNRPPKLIAVRPVLHEDLPDGMLALEAEVEDTEGDSVGYQWTTNQGTLVGDWQKPILITRGSGLQGPIQLNLSLNDSRGGYEDFSANVQFSQERDRYGLWPYNRSSYELILANPYQAERYHRSYSLTDETFSAYPKVESLLEALKSKDPRERWIAVTWLGDVTVERKQVIPVLINSLNDSDPNVVAATMSALARFLVTREIRPAAPLIIDRLKHDARAKVRIAAASALASFLDNKESIPALLQTLEDRDEAVSGAAAASLGKIGSEAKSGLIERLKNPDADLKTRQLAATALAGDGMDENDPEIMAALVSVLNSAAGVELRRSAAYSLARLIPSDIPTIRSIIQNAGDKSAPVRSACVSVLWSISNQSGLPDEIWPALLKAIKDDNAEVRRNAVAAMGNMSSKPDDWITVVLDALKDSDAEVRHYAAAALTNERDYSSILSPVILILKDSTAHRGGAAQALGQMQLDAADAAPAIEALKATLSDSDSDVRIKAAYSLARLAYLDEGVTQELIGFLTNPDPHLKNAAISALWDVKGRGVQQSVLQTSSTNIQNGLVRALNDESNFVRANAAFVLGFDLPEEDSPERKDLEATITSALTKIAVSDENPEVAVAAARGLIRAQNFCRLAPELLKSRFTTVRGGVLEVIGRRGCFTQEYGETLIDPIFDLISGGDNLAVWSRALYAIRFYAYYSARTLFPDDSNPESQLPQYLNQRIYERSQRLLESPNAAIRQAGISALAVIGDSRSFLMISRLVQDPDPRVRRTALSALLDTRGERALPYLEAAIQDPDLRVHYTAQVLLLDSKKTHDRFYEYSVDERNTLIYVLKNGDPESSSLASSILRSEGYRLRDPEINADKAVLKLRESDRRFY